VGFAASTREKITAASGKIENCDHILRRGYRVVFESKFDRLNNSGKLGRKQKSLTGGRIIIKDLGIYSIYPKVFLVRS
jgi:hypothetical protein